MNPHLIVLDLDGTLLNSNKEISPFTEKILKALIKEGHLIIFASGRPFRTMEKFYNQLELNTPVIGYNGGELFPMGNDIKGYRTYFEKGDVLKIIDEVGFNTFSNIALESPSKVYILNTDDEFSKWFPGNGLEVIIGDFRKNLNENPQTFLYHINNIDYIERINMIANKINKGIKTRAWSGGFFGEFYFDNVDKLYGIEKIINFYNIKKDDVLVFGDANNDILMLKNFKNSIAMSNGCQQAKDVAKYITKYDNDHDGVGIFLSEYFNIKCL